MGPWLADTIRQCDGLVDEMSYWTFSDVFEEQGVVKTPFYGGFGLLAANDIPKPSFNAFRLLHALGDQRLEINSTSALLTRRKGGSLVLAVWNYAPPEHIGSPKTVTVQFRNAKAKQALVSLVDPDHGDVHKQYSQMGSPRYPTTSQIQQLQKAAELPPSQSMPIRNNELTLTVPSYGLAVIELK
jgi:xylan 1,4-beta-xylosidase